MIKLTKYSSFFSSSKYFLDTKFKNFTAIANDTPGALEKLCRIFSNQKINLSYLRTHYQNIHIGKSPKYRLQLSIHTQKYFDFQNTKKILALQDIQITQSPPIEVPWFPKSFSDVNQIGQILLDVNQSKQHPQFQDKQYVARRNVIADIAKKFKMGDEIPNVDYSKQQTQLWTRIYKRLSQLHKNSMCSRFLKESQNLNKQFKLSQRIPQLRDLSQYLQSKTGFTIKPTSGILSQRQFLNAFAFKIFCSTQYLRNVKNPDYTPQPDIVHQFVGHVPMFSDPDVAQLSHKIGLLSLGASDEQIAKLGTLYWFTLQFGVCRQNDKNLGYGAGIASSIGQIQHMLTNKPKFQLLNIFKDCYDTYPVQTVQPIYKVTQSFQGALNDLQKYGRQIMKPFTTVWNYEKKQVNYDRCIQAIFSEDKGPKF